MSHKKVTPRYHKIAHNSNVDESLFGDSSSRSVSNHSSTRKASTISPTSPNAVIISEAELNRLKKCAVIKTEEQERLEREAVQIAKEEKNKIARARKQRMIELEQLAKKNALKSDAEIQDEARKEAIRLMAEERLIEDSDVVKLLRTLGARAAAFTIRDKQLAEKKRLEDAEEEYNRRLDMMMEVDRLKDLQRREEEESSKRMKRLEDRKVITEQIVERQRQKILMAEAREQENIAMRAMKMKFEDDDKVAAEKRKVEVERARLEVLNANNEAIRRKKNAKLEEKQEMEEILKYQTQRAAEMQRREEEEERIAKMKKEAQLKMLASQERSHNKQSEIDELRARRAAEEMERKVRKQERDAAEKRKNDIRDLTNARIKQAEDKKKCLAAEKALENEELQAALLYTKKMTDREESERRGKMNAAQNHRKALQDQIEDNSLRKKMNRGGEFDEGADARQKYLSELTKLETIRAKMVEDLEREGVNPRYLTEMKSLDIKKLLNR